MADEIKKNGINGVNGVTILDSAKSLVSEKLIDNNEKKSTEKSKNQKTLLYNITAIPPWYTCLILGFQHYMAMFIGNLAAPFLLSDALCMGDDGAVKAELVGVQFFVCGIITLMQVTLGVRLPIVQGSTFSLLVPSLSYLSLPKNTCPLIMENCSDQINNNVSCVIKGSEEYQEVWQSRLVTIQGSIVIASLLEILLGLSGGIGFLLRFIGPLSICPTISLLGLSLFRKSAEYGAKNWPVCIMTLFLLIMFSQYLSVLNIIFPKYKKGKGCVKTRYPLFKMFPVILAVLLSWFVCYMLTVLNAIPNDPKHWAYGGRTDLQTEILKDSPWFTIFWPGKYGMPRLDVSLIMGLLAGFMSSIIESVGDYHACSRMACAPPPPKHAINRGIMTEGFGCLLAGLFGTGNGSTSTSQNIGVIGLTRVGSRIVIIYTGCIMVGFAVFNKFGSLFVTVPHPIVGAAFTILFGMVVAVGLSNLQYVDMNQPRNLFVFGFSFFMGLTISEYMNSNPGVINSGNETVDNISTVLLSTSMFVGGVLGFILDNTVPGSKKERGILSHKKDMRSEQKGVPQEDLPSIGDVYGLPLIGSRLKHIQWLKYIPICPNYGLDNNEDTSSDVFTSSEEISENVEEV